MSIQGDFRQRADECKRFAKRTKSPQDEKLFLDMAQAWRGFSNGPEKHKDASLNEKPFELRLPSVMPVSS